MTCRPIVARTDREALARYEALLRADNAVLLGIYQRDSHCLVGKISFFDYNQRNRCGEIGYFLLPDYRGQGLAKKAMRLAHTAIFSHIGAHKITAQTAAFNVASIGLLLSLGYRQDGILREHHELLGTLYDDHLYSLLRREYEEQVIL